VESPLFLVRLILAKKYRSLVEYRSLITGLFNT
jgi:hypothetical protein